MADQSQINDDQVQALADILSLVAIIGQVDQIAMRRVLASLGGSLMEIDGIKSVDAKLTRSLIAGIAVENGEESAIRIARDLQFVGEAWKPVLDEHLTTDDPYRLLPFAEILFGLVNHSGKALQSYECFDRLGGADMVLPMRQLSAAISPYAIPEVGLKWELVGFKDPSDQALIAGNAEKLYLFKSASSGIDLRFSELERESSEDAKREQDIRVDAPLYAAFIAGLLGDMLYWTARMRSHSLPGYEIWKNLRRLLMVNLDEPTEFIRVDQEE